MCSDEALLNKKGGNKKIKFHFRFLKLINFLLKKKLA